MDADSFHKHRYHQVLLCLALTFDYITCIREAISISTIPQLSIRQNYQEAQYWYIDSSRDTGNLTGKVFLNQNS